MKTKCFVLFLLVTVSSISLHAQLIGTYSIPGNYSTISSAVVALNSAGVGAGGVTFNVAANHTETLSGAIVMTATGTAANPVVFQRIGGGANPLITAYTGVSQDAGIPDGIWILKGSDYVTIDGIDLLDPNTENTTTMMEFGYGLFCDDTNYGSRYNTIKNCEVTLNRYNDSYNTLTIARGSVGILVLNARPGSAQSQYTSVNDLTSNSNNKIYGNTIINCSIGILLRGYNSSMPYAGVNRGNDVGGTSASTGNHILNFGGGNDVSPAVGIKSYYQWDFNISYNTIDNNTSTGVNHTNVLYGIKTFGAPNTEVPITHNNISLKSGSVSSNVYGISNRAGDGNISYTININYNRIYECSYSLLNSGYFFGIENWANAGLVNINHNTFEDFSQMTCQNFVGIVNLYGYGNDISFNVFQNLAFASNSGSATMINPKSTNNTVTHNEISNISSTPQSTTTGYIINAIHSNPNSISNAGIYSNNTISNISITGSNNAPNSVIIGVSLSTQIADAESQVFDNQISGFSYSTGRYASLRGIHVQNGIVDIARNKIQDFYANGSSSSVRGISCSNVATHIYNNMIYDLGALNSSLSTSTVAIDCSGISNGQVSFNTVFLSATEVGPGFSSAAIVVGSNPTFIRNNIFINTSVPGYNGRTVAVYSSLSSNSGVGTGSDNNIYYAGTPGIRNFIGYFASISYQTLADYKTFMVDKEQNSLTENVPFVSVVEPIDLHINLSIPTLAEGNAQPIAGVDYDFDSELRNPVNPDIGADEGNFMIIPEPPSSPVYLSPSDGQNGVDINAPITWIAGAAGGNPSSYSVYFGSSTPVPLLGNTTESSYQPIMDYQTTYYWQIVAHNYSGSAAGPLWSFTTETDYRITSLPHSQNFDGVTAPDLPPGWTKLTAPGSVIQTGTAHSNTAPNSVVFTLTSDDSSVTPPLVSPQVTVGVENIRMSFWAKRIGGIASIIIGTMADPQIESTFSAFSILELTTDYSQYTVDFSTFTGSDQYIAFRMTSQYINASVSLDTILLQQAQAENDLAVLYVTGSTFGFPSFSTAQTVTIENRGMATQNSFTVRLMSADGPSVLMSQNYTQPLEPGQTTAISLNWIPQVEGTYFVYGEVVLPGDENIADNTSAIRQINVYPWTTYGAVVGDEDSSEMSNHLPYSFSFRNSLSETIYTSTEMQMLSGNLEGIIYESWFAQDLIDKPVKLWVKNTAATDLSAGWLDFEGYTLVFDGLISIMSGEYNYVHIPFSAPFNYTGGNLAVRACRPMDNQSYAESNAFYFSTPAYMGNRSRYLMSNPEVIDPSNPYDPGFLTSDIPFTVFVAPVANPVVLSPPDVTIVLVGADIHLTWNDVPGAYCYRIFSSDYPYAWPEVPDTVIYTNSYVYQNASQSKKYYRVVAASTYR